MKLTIGRPLLIVLTAVAGLAAAVSLISARTVRRAWQQSEIELQEIHTELVRRDELNFFEFDQFWRGAILNNLYQQIPLNQSLYQQLNIAEAWFNEYVSREESDNTPIWYRAKAYVNLARIYQVRNFNRQSQHAYDMARSLLVPIAGNSQDFKLRFALAIIESRRSCLLARVGKLPEARQAALNAIVLLEETAKKNIDPVKVRQEYAIALRNLGTIVTALGESGVNYFQRSCHIAEELSRKTMDLSSLSHEEKAGIAVFLQNCDFHIDACQLLARSLWRDGKFNAAEEASRNSLQSIRRRLEIGNMISDRVSIVSPILKYKSAQTRAERNLFSLKKDCKTIGEQQTTGSSIDTDNTPLASQWEWIPLVHMPGIILHHEMLTSGKLHGEFETQEALLIQWPDDEWPRKSLARMVEAAHRRITVVVLVNDALLEHDAKQTFRDAGVEVRRLRFCRAQSDSIWVRDYGPLTIEDAAGNIKYCDARYGANERFFDDQVPIALARRQGHAVIPLPIVLEGGALLTNGKGLCLVSSRILELNRPLGYDEAYVTSVIRRVTGAKHIVYLEPLNGEPTGHVDWFAAFTSPNTLVLGDYRGEDPVNGPLLDGHARQLEGMETGVGPLRVVRIPMPPRSKDHYGGTYTNVVFANGVLIMPTWQDAPKQVEREAVEIFQRLLPDWQIVGIDCLAMGKHFGGPHCATMNLYRFDPVQLPQPGIQSAASPPQLETVGGIP